MQDRASRSPGAGSLAEAQDRFIAAWGQMGSTWGISRTMAEAHALLYVTGEPLCTDDIMERLAISRGNASMSLRSLLDWGLVSRVHKRGDRKEYFEAEQDPWLMLQAIVRERMNREVHPVMASLAEERDRVDGEMAAGSDHMRRLDAMIHLLTVFSQLGERFAEAPVEHLRVTAETLSTGGAGAVP